LHISQIASASGLYTPCLRLGVTGLSRSGKTVFITSLVRNLVSGGRLPFLAVQSEGRLRSAFLQPQPDDDIPRFDYEAHLSKLTASPPAWPEGTRQISQLRVALRFTPRSRMRYVTGPAGLNLDIIDYPGEWLLDLAMLEKSFADWSAEALAGARANADREASARFLAFVGSLYAAGGDEEAVAIEGARLFTDHLVSARSEGSGIATLGPGRFLLPGDLAGSPLLTFFPLSAAETASAAKPLRAMLQRRYESYRNRVVRPFFYDHFSRLDRQIVLVDVLSAMNGGPASLASLQHAISEALKAFRPGVNSWLSSLFRPRIDRVLFAATKADHLHHTSHDRLEAILRLLTDRALTRASGAGADIGALALSAVRATRETEAQDRGERLHCIRGVPLNGEVIDGRIFDGMQEAVLFPGDLPADPKAALDPSTGWSGPGAAAFVRFRPPVIKSMTASGEAATPPHIRLDRALEFLIGDWLS
jgi:hypothetical protein